MRESNIDPARNLEDLFDELFNKKASKLVERLEVCEKSISSLNEKIVQVATENTANVKNYVDENTSMIKRYVDERLTASNEQMAIIQNEVVQKNNIILIAAFQNIFNQRTNNATTQ